MNAVLWSINILLMIIALVFLPLALRSRDPIILAGILITAAGFLLATVALWMM